MCLSATCHIHECECLCVTHTCVHSCLHESGGGGGEVTLCHASLILMDHSTWSQLLSLDRNGPASRSYYSCCCVVIITQACLMRWWMSGGGETVPLRHCMHSENKTASLCGVRFEKHRIFSCCHRERNLPFCTFLVFFFCRRFIKSQIMIRSAYVSLIYESLSLKCENMSLKVL